jgi:hypothetical protein
VTYPAAWQPFTPTFTAGSLARSPVTSQRICDQFDLSDARYLRDEKGQTKCNILVCDLAVGHALVPPRMKLSPGRHLDDATIAALRPLLPADAIDQLQAPRWRELDGNACVAYLVGALGLTDGWRGCTADEARQRANAGFPTVACLYNPAGVGHVAWVIDTPPGEPELHVMQAGATNFRRGRISTGFGHYMPQVTFVTHD